MSAVNIFPTPTTGRSQFPPDVLSETHSHSHSLSPTSPSQDHVSGATTNSVYYLAFLAVLLALIILAGALMLRSYHVRTRYRTQTQLAIGRGEAPTGWWADDVWGVPWVGWAPARPRRRRQWMPIPVLFDVVPEAEKGDLVNKDVEEGVETDDWHEIQPLSVQSLLPPDPEPEPDIPTTPFPFPEPTGGRLRTAGTGLRRRMGLDVLPLQSDPPQPTASSPEMERSLADGEPLRVAVMVLMPTESDAVSVLIDADEIAWRPGMEVGVWEGIVAGGKRSMSSDYTPSSTYAEYTPSVGPPPSHLAPSNPYSPTTALQTLTTSNAYERSRALSLDTGDIGSGSTLWTPAKAAPSPSTMNPRPRQVELTHEVLQPQPNEEHLLSRGASLQQPPDTPSQQLPYTSQPPPKTVPRS
ncbi:hypothetical protein CspeluHIS016_0300280 [Cutaneotrichosporon spelunceum]|uniref:Uncharacterized protein n=1 Tax=Cutaneotrichosporon spelunceum TaxID=1672016 RepID=A0AAD3TSP2_9TREE|nr:hypothetical protein CspeluHIS016_0300280 [Cutaneotrichosporon spelunceum]